MLFGAQWRPTELSRERSGDANVRDRNTKASKLASNLEVIDMIVGKPRIRIERGSEETVNVRKILMLRAPHYSDICLLYQQFIGIQFEDSASHVYARNGLDVGETVGWRIPTMFRTNVEALLLPPCTDIR